MLTVQSDFLNWVSESLAKAIRFTPPGLKVDVRVFLTKNQSHPYLSSTTLERQTNFEATHSNPFEDPNHFAHPSNQIEKPEEAIFTLPWVKVTSGRPDLEHIIREEMNAASGKVSVSGRCSGFCLLYGPFIYLQVCGPNAMANVVRKALRLPWSSPSSPLNGGPSVTLHVECFGYA